MTDQEIYDKVYAGFEAQGWQKGGYHNLNQKFECSYRSPNGTKCAAGHLIPDELYERQMEGTSWNGLIKSNDSLSFMFSFSQHDLIRKLQNAHDSAAPEQLKDAITQLNPKNNEA
jgi:hypothetical protein